MQKPDKVSDNESEGFASVSSIEAVEEKPKEPSEKPKSEIKKPTDPNDPIMDLENATNTTEFLLLSLQQCLKCTPIQVQDLLTNHS